MIEIVHCSILRITLLFSLQMFSVEKFGYFINFRCLYIAANHYNASTMSRVNITVAHVFKRCQSVSVLF